MPAEKVQYVCFLDGNAFVADSQLFFGVKRNTAIIEFAFEALLIDLFLESAAHLVVDFIDRSANCVAFVWVYQSFVHMATIIAKSCPAFVQPRRGVFVGNILLVTGNRLRTGVASLARIEV